MMADNLENPPVPHLFAKKKKKKNLSSDANCPLATTLSQPFNVTHFVVQFFNQHNEVNIQLLSKCL